MLNIKMMGHQRDILATMGIDIWIPRSVARVHHSQSSGLWRDQAQPEINAELPLSQIVVPISSEPDIQDIDDVLTQFVEVEQEIVQQPPKPITPVIAEVQPQPAIHIEAFELQAVSLATCLIVLDASQLTEAQSELWVNIQQAIPAEYHELKWPFPLLEMQDGRGAGSYVQGFIDAIGVDKDLIALGDISHLQQVDLQRLASLQEMLEQPILKKRLWQFMQKSLNTRMNDE
ncbi:hypothetical protein [Acinetobacter zhairhuonensis]|uniref:hypothetical protein n=1 Tax=Acinetobacter sp. A7.4 TaxID=2919921 RepID=UPI001F4DE826|nr:hypothetical protein [Acinetobacter sp. A7.4]MCJ8160570.1 hypothetical protein [Acinetobacter sp. A7.4]